MKIRMCLILALSSPAQSTELVLDLFLSKGLSGTKPYQIFKTIDIDRYEDLNLPIMVSPIQHVFPCCPGLFQSLWQFIQEASWTEQENHQVNDLMAELSPDDPLMRYLNDLAGTEHGRNILHTLLPLLGNHTSTLDSINELDELYFRSMALLLVHNPGLATHFLELLTVDSELFTTLLRQQTILELLAKHYRTDSTLNLTALAATFVTHPWLQELAFPSSGIPADMVLLLAIAFTPGAWNISVSPEIRQNLTLVHRFISAYLLDMLIIQKGITLGSDHEELAWIITSILAEHDGIASLIFGLHDSLSSLGLMPVLSLAKLSQMLIQAGFTDSMVSLRLFQIIRRPRLVNIISRLSCSNPGNLFLIFSQDPEMASQALTKPTTIQHWIYAWMVLTNPETVIFSAQETNPLLIQFVNEQLKPYLAPGSPITAIIATDLQNHFPELAGLRSIDAIFRFFHSRLQQGQLRLPELPQILFMPSGPQVIREDRTRTRLVPSCEFSTKDS